MQGPVANKRTTALEAQRQLRITAFNVAPAVAAGLIAGSHLDAAGDGLVVALAVFAVSKAVERERIPLHLMPLASFVVRALVPLIGIGIALGIFALGEQSVWAPAMVAPLVGAWLASLVGFLVVERFQGSRQVRVAMIGPPELALGLSQELRNAGIRSHRVVGWIADEYSTPDSDVDGPVYLGSLDGVRKVVDEKSIELLVYSSIPGVSAKRQPSRLELFERVASACLDSPVRLLEASRLYEDLLGHVPLGQSTSAWFQYLMHPSYRAGSPLSKRLFDLFVGSGMLILLAPVLAVFAAIVKLTDGGPIFYRQLRVGEGGREFEMIKLRSMRVESEDEGPQWSAADDARVTSVGRIMRRLHIDEMPQLWNVLRGEMTIVGPRPERRGLIVLLERQLAYYDRRHLVKPGLAGWAQARCGYGGSEEGTGWKLCHDLFYLKHRSVYFDTLILIENVRVSLSSSVQFGTTAPQDQFILHYSSRLP